MAPFKQPSATHHHSLLRGGGVTPSHSDPPPTPCDNALGAGTNLKANFRGGSFHATIRHPSVLVTWGGGGAGHPFSLGPTPMRRPGLDHLQDARLVGVRQDRVVHLRNWLQAELHEHRDPTPFSGWFQNIWNESMTIFLIR